MAQRTTKRYGTPCSPAWDDAWIATVEEAENRHGKAICGARTLAGTPCPLAANHENGRCKFHGGFNCTGAQPGNRNAVLHGLYARGLQRCGRHCPQWEHCPLASEEVDKLPKHNRPQCPYEVAQFQMAESDLEAQSGAKDGMGRHNVLQAALTQVMVLRAGAALAIQGATETSEVRSEKYEMMSSKPSAALTAYLKPSTEYQRCVERLPQAGPPTDDYEEQLRVAERFQSDSEITPEAKEKLQGSNEAPGKAPSQGYIEEAAESVREIRAIQEKAAVYEEKAAARVAEEGNDTVQGATVTRYLKRTAENIAQCETAARRHYARAFTLYPGWRGALQGDPAHDPAYFPEEIALAAVG